MTGNEITQPEKKNNLDTRTDTSGIFKNSVYNLLGYLLPIVFAIVFIPIIIRGLGDEKFGVLNLAWIVIGYFSFFDFGLSRTLTKVVAEKISLREPDTIPKVFWTSFYLTIGFSLIGTVLILLTANFLVVDVFKISSNLQKDSISTFYLLALSLPIVTTSASLRGFLEAYHRFSIASIIKVVLGILTFTVPAIVLIFSNKLFLIVLFLVIVRLFIWLVYLAQCFRINPEIKQIRSIDTDTIKPLLKISSWMTVSNLIGPLIIYVDRFLIGALISAVAITYYATPYELITKILVIPSAIVGVLFPTFSAASTNLESSKKIFDGGVKFIFLLIFPVVLVIIPFSNEILTIWLNQRFATESSFVLQILSLGVIINSIAYVPFTYLQGVGRPDVPAKIHILELSFYLVGMWFAIQYFGINGAALVWCLRILVDSLAMFYASRKVMSMVLVPRTILIIILSLPFPFLLILINNILIKMIMLLFLFIGFTLISWNFILHRDEKEFLLSVINRIKKL